MPSRLTVSGGRRGAVHGYGLLKGQLDRLPLGQPPPRHQNLAGRPRIVARPGEHRGIAQGRLVLGPLRSETSNAVARAVPEVNVLSFSNTTSSVSCSQFV